MEPMTFKRDKVNVGESERLASLVGGGVALLISLAQPGRFRLPALLGGGYLLYRGLTGKCYFYEALGINRAETESGEGIFVSRTVTVGLSSEEVYRFWSKLEVLPQFMKHLESVRVTGDRTSHRIARAPLGKTVEWDAEIVEDNPGQRIAWRSLPGAEVENWGEVSFSPAPRGRGAEVHVKLQYKPPAGSASAAIAKLLGEEPSLQVLEDLRHFKQIIEAGETATVTGQTSGRIDQTQKEREQIRLSKRKDIVQEASEQSFPASDPPSFAVGKEESKL